MKRVKRVIITLTPEEWEAIRAAAAEDGRPTAAYIRHSAVEAAKGNAKHAAAGVAPA